ncbi:DNA-binding transcriptional LysR family regulator [Dokdonia sp. Hel_I_63]|uniref:LysR family transcriptional regulator n=1 Tax=Dokdonia sp. Hel_I_63 TaxID=1249996 RepID=UPI00119C71C3|nr:LysR family transcriptional regulator [Dokdonia sp. Hel_I_63]TVZ21769.1 DNA-binding transcriptional LysR family regulator [Dokdonia sp. Hel_I_63]
MHYTLHQLQVFLKVTEFKSITKAAEELHLTQPAVSIQIKNFQNQFPIPLTEVVGRQLFVTDFGEEIAAAARKIIAEVDAINYKTMAYQGQLSGKLKISIVSTGKYLMPYYITDFMNMHPGVDLEMDVTNKTRVVRHLEKNETDFALVSVVPDHIAIDKVTLIPNKLFLVGGRQHTYSGKTISKKDFDKLPVVYREKGSATRAAMENYIADRQLPTRKKIELTSNEAVKQAVISGIGISILPLVGLKNALTSGDVQIIPSKGLPITTHWNLIWQKSKQLSPTAQAFVSYLEEHKTALNVKHFGWLDTY